MTMTAELQVELTARVEQVGVGLVDARELAYRALLVSNVPWVANALNTAEDEVRRIVTTHPAYPTDIDFVENDFVESRRSSWPAPSTLSEHLAGIIVAAGEPDTVEGIPVDLLADAADFLEHDEDSGLREYYPDMEDVPTWLRQRVETSLITKSYQRTSTYSYYIDPYQDC